ncbi:MAG TPA: DNA-3-methyladenine glycosylase [Candidatus Dormibacteraeota bacterium]|nr:DNA-3-methyladenine glycosylase [Candidatus Dormibacteraeota bacterium]
MTHRRHPRLGRPLDLAELPIETVALARRLVGVGLGVASPDGIVGGRIVEVEAYLPDDPASHAFRGPTRRNRAMFGPPLHAYVYFIYGNHWCFNITSEPEGVGAAVLIRALEPLAGVEVMALRRGAAPARDLARGPGRLAQALAIGGGDDGAPIGFGGRIALYDTGGPPEIAAGPRVGISAARELPLRFAVAGSRFVSSPLPRPGAMV